MNVEKGITRTCLGLARTDDEEKTMALKRGAILRGSAKGGYKARGHHDDDATEGMLRVAAQVFKPSQQSIIAQGEATIRRALVIKQMLSRHGSRESPEVRYGDFLFHVGRWDARPTMYWRLHSAPQVSQGRALSHCARCWLRVSHDAVWGCAKPRPTQSTCARGHMLQHGRNRSPGKWV